MKLYDNRRGRMKDYHQSAAKAAMAGLHPREGLSRLKAILEHWGGDLRVLPAGKIAGHCLAHGKRWSIDVNLHGYRSSRGMNEAAVPHRDVPGYGERPLYGFLYDEAIVVIAAEFVELDARLAFGRAIHDAWHVLVDRSFLSDADTGENQSAWLFQIAPYLAGHTERLPLADRFVDVERAA